MPRLPIVPIYSGPPIGVAPVATINGVAQPPEVIQATYLATLSTIAVRYGRSVAGARIFCRCVWNGNFVLGVSWGRGPVQAIDQVYIDNKAPNAAIAITTYLGAQVAPDATLVAAFAAQSPPIAYSDVLPGIAYSVFVIPPGLTQGFPRISALGRWRLLYDPRVPTTAYSDNPGLALADFITNPKYGMGRSIDWASVEEVADHCDEMVGTPPEKRRTINLSIERPATVASWVEALRTYASCFVVESGGVMALVADMPRAVAGFALNADNSTLASLKKRGRLNVPTAITIAYTDTSQVPWREARVTRLAEGVQEGTTRFRESTVKLEGVVRFSQAYREAIERLNKLQLRDLSGEWRVRDEGVKIVHGDVIPVTHPIGLAAKPMMSLSYSLDSAGRWVHRMLEYDAAVFANDTPPFSTNPDTTLPNPAVVATPTALSITEKVYLEKAVAADSLARGLIYQSRFDVTWAAPVHAYPLTYRIQFRDGDLVVHEGQTPSLGYASPTVQQGRTYTVRVIARNSLGFESSVLEGSLAAQGKLLPPGNVPAITTSFEIGGEVILQWLPAVDIDVMRYEWRYAAAGGFSWASATLIDRVDGLRARFSGLPVGAWRFAVKAIDSVGNYSATEATVDLTVTSDADAFLQSREYTNPLIIGDERVLQGDMSSGTNWSLGAGWAISGGKLTATAAADGTFSGQAGWLTVGKLYRIEFTIDAISGGAIKAACGAGFSSAAYAAPGTYVLTATCVADGTLALVAIGTTTATIDNLSYREVGNIAEIPALEPGSARRWATSVWGDAWNTALPNPVNSGSNPVISYHTSAPSRFVGEAWDLGTLVTGDWTLTPNTTNLVGTATYAIETSGDGTTWTRQPGTVWKGSARMVRPVIETLTTGTMIVQTPKISLAALSKSEAGAVTTLSSGGKLVQLTGRYSGAQDLQATAINTAAARIVTADRILLHPEAGLMLKATAAGGGNCYCYHSISTAGSRVIAAGDHIEYDVFVDPSSPASASVGAFEVDSTTASGRNYPLVDAVQGAIIQPNLPRGQWVHMKAPLAPMLGQTIANILLVNEADPAGDYTVLYRGIQISDGAGTTRVMLWSTGEPSLNTTAYSSLVSNVRCGPANSFFLYAFDAAGTQVAQDTQYAFRGF